MASIKKITTKGGETRYVVRYRDPDGASRERRFRRKADAEEHGAGVLTDIARGDYLDPNAGRITFVNWSRKWIDSLGGKKPSTLATYEDVLKNLVNSEFGNKRLSSIKPMAIGKWMKTLEERGVSVSRRRQAFWVLSGCLKAAVDDDRIRRNPADRARQHVPSPRTERTPIFLTMEQVHRLASAVDPEHLPLVYTLALSGLRWGEVCAIRHADVNLDFGRIHVRESLSEVGGRLQFVSPKSGRERRVVVPRFLVDLLQVHLAERVDSGVDALVFVNSQGGAMRASNFRHRVWGPAVERAGLPHKLTIHDLRHTSASLLIHLGAHLEMVRDQLGHSTIAVTQRYSHLYPAAIADISERLDAHARGVLVGLPSDESGPGDEKAA